MTPTNVTKSEARTLIEFSSFLMTPHQMLCFSGPDLESKKSALETLADKEMLTRELRDGGVTVVEDRCIMVDHRRLCPGAEPVSR